MRPEARVDETVRARWDGAKGSSEVAMLRESWSSEPSSSMSELRERPVMKATPFDATRRP